jgi:hypothetical protein
MRLIGSCLVFLHLHPRGGSEYRHSNHVSTDGGMAGKGRRRLMNDSRRSIRSNGSVATGVWYVRSDVAARSLCRATTIMNEWERRDNPVLQVADGLLWLDRNVEVDSIVR